jgi:hypothetical protein
MSFLKSKHSGWLSDGTRTPFGGASGGGGSQPTQSTSYQTNVPEYARPYVETMLGAAQKQTYKYDDAGNVTGFQPYVPYGATVGPGGEITNTAQEQAKSAIAGFSPMQEQAFQQIANMQVPGQFALGTGYQALGGAGALQAAQGAQPLMGEALGYGAAGAQYGGIGAQQALQRAQQTARQAGVYGGMGAGYGGRGAQAAEQGFGAGEAFARQATDPGATQAYMSPYMQNVVDVQKQEAMRDFAKQMPAMQAQAVRQGAFGGSRSAIEAAEARRNLGTQLGQIQATGTQQAFQDAQRQQQFGANLGLQGLQAGYGGLGLGIQGAQAGLQGVGAQQAAGQLGLQGTAQGMQGAGVGLSGVGRALDAGQYGLQGFGAATQAGSALGQMGGQQLQAQQGILGLQTQAGGQQQALEQQRINQAIQNYALQQQNPQMQLSLMSSLLRGLPLQQATTQTYQAAPSTISQIGGLGLAGAGAYGLMRKEGGIIKSYAEGGAVESDDAEDFASGGITRKVMLNPEKYSADTIDRSTKNGVINDIVGLAALQQKNQETKERQAQMAMAQGTPPTIKDQILAEAQQLQGIDNAPSNLPTEYAGGGIVAFQEGGSTMGGFETESDPAAMALDEIRRQEAEKRSYASMLGYTKPEAAPAAAAAPAAKPDTGIRILPDEPKAAPSIMNAPTAAAEPTKATGTGGIDDLIRQITGDIRTSQESSKDARKEAKLMAMLQAGLGIASGTSQYAAANLKGAMPALQGYQEEMRGLRSDEAKQIAQIAALNLKGAELKQELDKLGITKERYDSQNKVDAARAQYLLGGGARGAGGGANYGPVTNETYLKLKGQYDNFMVNPKSDPTLFAALPKRVKDALKANVGTPSHDRGLAEVRDFANQRFANDINTMRILAARKGPNASAPYNPALE